MKTVMAAVDFSVVTDRVVSEAIRLARLLKARIVLARSPCPFVVVPGETAMPGAFAARAGRS